MDSNTKDSITIGDSSMFAGVQIERYKSQKSIFFTSESYAKKIVKRFGMSEAKPNGVPIDPHVLSRRLRE